MRMRMLMPMPIKRKCTSVSARAITARLCRPARQRVARQHDENTMELWPLSAGSARIQGVHPQPLCIRKNIYIPTKLFVRTRKIRILTHMTDA
jgi:hypothetical protein